MSVEEADNAYNLGMAAGVRAGSDERRKMARRLHRILMAATRWLESPASQRALNAHTTMVVIRATADKETDDGKEEHGTDGPAGSAER